jgi:hypothetical protein
MATPVSDRNRAELHEIVSHLGKPAYVKTAAEVDFGELDRIPSSSFADPETRQYPCHTKEACWVSAAYMAHDGVSGAPIKRLEKFAADWGIGSDVQIAFAKAEIRKEMAKAAAAAVPYALDEQYGEERIKRFPVATPEMVKTSADRFYADRAKYPWKWRTKVASALLSKIAEHRVEKWINPDVRDYLDRAAARGTLDKAAMWDALAAAEYYLPNTAGVAKLAEIVDALDKSESPALAKVACDAFATIHETAGLSQFVNGLPEEKLIGKTMMKIAEERASFVKMADGSTLNLDDLPMEKLAAVVPELAKMSRDELRDVLPTLPADVAETLRLVTC